MINEIYHTMQVLTNLKSIALILDNQLPKSFKKSEDNKLIYFEVKDTGSGMNEDVISKLGGEYNTFGQCTNDNKEGIGLGLYISK